MLHRIMKSIVAIILIASLMISTCSCSKKKSTDAEKQWYSCSSFQIPAKEGYSQSVYSYFYTEGYYYLSIYGQKLDEKTEGDEEYYCLCVIDSDGNDIKQVFLPVKYACMSHQIVINNRLYCADINSNIEYVIDINTGKTISKENANESILGYYFTDDGYIKHTVSNLIQYSKDGCEKCRIKIQNIENIISIYQRKSETCLIEDKNGYLIFYIVNYDKGILEKAVELDFAELHGFSLDNGIFFSNDGVYYMNTISKALVPITKWNYVDIKPAYKKMFYEMYISFGNEKFGKLYAYSDYEIELIIFTSISAEKYNARKQITIGGYGVNNSLAVKWAAYEFNTSQSEYRIYLDDYWNDYSYSSGIEAQSQIAKLIKYFNDGNSPDIYYGTNFDYRYMYNAGLVTDMLPIMKNDPDFDMDELIPSIKDTVTRNDACYQIFSAYSFDGDFGLKNVFGNDEVTFLEIDSISQEKGISIRGDMPAAEFADQIIRYSLGDLVDRSTGSHVLSVEELRNIVEYSIRNGIPYDAYSNSIADMDTVHYGTYLTCRRTWLGNLYDVADIEGELRDSFVYLGFPSVYGSAHAAKPDGLVAISADTENTDACWQFIKCMLTDEIQEIEIGQGNNPVKRNVFEDYCRYAEDPELVPETEVIWKSIVCNRDPVPSWIISDYQSMVNSINSVISYDWGLYNIICEEINSYYTQNKSVDEITITLQARLDLYVSENYK